MFKGSIVALVTPFRKDKSVDIDKLRFLINWQIKNKTDAILVCGTTGESATLSHEEHRQVVRTAVEECRGRIPVIAGAGSNSTQEALSLGLFARKVKADAILVITPYYNKPTPEGLYRHYRLIAKETKMPLIIYNVPSRTGINILPETVARIYKECKNVIGIKEASGNIEQITKIMRLVDSKFLLLSGSDEITLPIMSLGAKGVISVVANIVPRKNHEFTEAFLKGDISQSRKMQLYLYDLIKTLFIETNPMPVKAALSFMGMVDYNVRLPLCGMMPDNLKKLKAVLQRYGLIKERG